MKKDDRELLINDVYHSRDKIQQTKETIDRN